ncbi:MAG: hypothetical protein AXA67_05890 [Methylothermaceae bacteria B42]|nr:MAG: hypothetical protein AXA67_05890 [Methylothermaceae bacteria B42]HHJ38668.1 glycosyltransferase [Methylothermaceae bacterium]
MQKITNIELRKTMPPPRIDYRIAVYSHDTFGLGNIRRMLAICQYLLDNNPHFSILLITGSPVIHRLPLPTERFDYVKLPCLSRTEAEKYQVKSLGTTFDMTMRLRAQMIKTTLMGFHPDIVIVDKKPCGVAKELMPALEASSEAIPRAQWVLLLRDILDAPGKTRQVWRKHRYFDVIDRHYAQILVVGSQKIFDLGEEYGFPPRIKSIMKYCGYIHKSPTVIPQKNLATNGTRTVLVTPGGGQDGFRMIRAYLQGLEIHPDKGWKSLIITGPEMDGWAREEIAHLASRVNAAVTVQSFTADMQGTMSQADVIVSMGGYNSLCEIVSLGKPAVIVPRKAPVQEQWIRAQRFAHQGWVHCLDPETLTPSQLMEAIDNQLNRTLLPPPLQGTKEWQGLVRVSQAIRLLLADPGFMACHA